MNNNFVINLIKLIKFLDNDFEEEVKIYHDKEDFVLEIWDKTIKHIDIRLNSGLSWNIIFFPIIKCLTYFKWVEEFKTNEYIFLYLYIIDENHIVIFSNNIRKYIEKIKNDDNIMNFPVLEENIFEKLTSSFYLFSKNDNIYEWQNILNFFPIFLNIAFKDNDYKDLLHKIKWDSVAFFKTRFVQEKNITTIISKKEEWKNLFHSMFYANILKNLTFRIAENYIDLNAKWKWWFHIATTKNSVDFFEKISRMISSIEDSGHLDKTEFPVFFLEWNIWQNNQNELKNYLFIDLFPIAFKKDWKQNRYLLNFSDIDRIKDIVISDDINLNDLFGGSGGISYEELKSNIQDAYKYELLEERSQKDSVIDIVTNTKKVADNDLYMLFKSQDNNLFIWKIKEIPIEWVMIVNREKWKANSKKEEYKFEDMILYYKTKSDIQLWQKEGDDQEYYLPLHNITLHKKFGISFRYAKKWYYVEAYKLYANIGGYVPNLKNAIIINKKEEGFYYGDESTGKVVFSCENKDGKIFSFFSSIENPDNLTYFFNGAWEEFEDEISLWLIWQLNNWSIYIWDKKSSNWELADIIWYKIEWDSAIVHLLHIKTSPFIKNWRQETFSYYTTAIGQMLQKIEPILSGDEWDFFQYENINSFKDSLCEHKIIDVEKEFIVPLKGVKTLELRIGIAILENQIPWKINNSVFYMIEKILLAWYENSIKPFLWKNINITFYPIIVTN